MSSWKRIVVLLAVVALLPLVACGGGEEAVPANEEPGQDEAAPDEATEPAETMAPVDEEPEATEPEGPQLVGNITLTGEDFDWGETTTDSADYTWTVTISNDTTSNLDVTVVFEFLDDSDRAIKREQATVRMAPATRRTIRESGDMSYDEANRVYSFAARYDYSIVEG